MRENQERVCPSRENTHAQSTPSKLLTKLLNTLRKEYAPSRENAHAQGPCVISTKSTVYDKVVLILLFMNPFTVVSVLILLYMCPHTAIYVSSYCCICAHTAIYVSSYCYILLYMCPHAVWWGEGSKPCDKYVLILLNVSACCYMCVLILLYTCPHTAIYVSSYCYICVLICYVLLYVSSYCVLRERSTVSDS